MKTKNIMLILLSTAFIISLLVFSFPVVSKADGVDGTSEKTSETSEIDESKTETTETETNSNAEKHNAVPFAIASAVIVAAGAVYLVLRKKYKL